MEIEVKEVLPAKASAPIVVMVSGIDTEEAVPVYFTNFVPSI